MNRDPTGTGSEFHAGDSVVVLYDGRYNGMAGRFVGLKADPNWADIEEQNGRVRSHPVTWLRTPAAIMAEKRSSS